MITKKLVAEKMLQYLQHKISADELIGWAEDALMESDFEPAEAKELREIVGKIGLADVDNFGLLWEDCEAIMHQLGYAIKIDVSMVA